MPRKALSPAAEQAAGLILQSKDVEVEASYLERQLDKERWEVVALMRELDAAGIGKFIAGRHGYQTRFAKALQSGGRSTSEQTEEFLEPENHVFILKREMPIRLTLPADLTRVEADRIVRWVNALPED